MTDREILELLLKSQTAVQDNISSILSDVNELRQSQVRMEQELTEKVRALFDARQVHLDYFASIKNDLVKLREEQDYINSSIYRLVQRQNEQERELRLVRLEKK